MIVFVNGRFVPEDRAVVSVFDRGFLYGDGIFETMLMVKGEPFRWEQHMDRFRSGLEYLKISIPYSSAALRHHTRELIKRNRMPDCLLRLTVSRGAGKRRGYSPADANSPSVVLSLHPAAAVEPAHPLRWNLITSKVRLPAHEPLAQFKTCAKIPQILARAEADAAGADDALLLNTEGFIVEGSSSNLFWLQGKAICTCPLPSGVLPGVTRVVLFDLCAKMGLATRHVNIVPRRLAEADAVFLSLTSLGIVECGSLDGTTLRRSKVVQDLSAAYWDLVKKETAVKRGQTERSRPLRRHK